MERPNGIAAKDERLRGEGLDAGFVVQMNKGIDGWFATVDALEMGVNDFDGRELFQTDAFGNLLDGRVGRWLHDWKRESKRARGLGQAPATGRKIGAHNNG